MKLKLTVLACVIAAGLLVGVSYGVYNNHQKEVKAQNTALQSQVDSQVNQLQTANDVVITKYNALVDQCNVGFADYNLLTGATKNQAKAPNCGLYLLQ